MVGACKGKTLLCLLFCFSHHHITKYTDVNVCWATWFSAEQLSIQQRVSLFKCIWLSFSSFPRTSVFMFLFCVFILLWVVPVMYVFCFSSQLFIILEQFFSVLFCSVLLLPPVACVWLKLCSTTCDCWLVCYYFYLLLYFHLLLLLRLVCVIFIVNAMNICSGRRLVLRKSLHSGLRLAWHLTNAYFHHLVKKRGI